MARYFWHIGSKPGLGNYQAVNFMMLGNSYKGELFIIICSFLNICHTGVDFSLFAAFVRNSSYFRKMDKKTHRFSNQNGIF